MLRHSTRSEPGSLQFCFFLITFAHCSLLNLKLSLEGAGTSLVITSLTASNQFRFVFGVADLSSHIAFQKLLAPVMFSNERASLFSFDPPETLYPWSGVIQVFFYYFHKTCIDTFWVCLHETIQRLHLVLLLFLIENSFCIPMVRRFVLYQFDGRHDRKFSTFFLQKLPVLLPFLRYLYFPASRGLFSLCVRWRQLREKTPAMG